MPPPGNSCSSVRRLTKSMAGSGDAALAHLKEDKIIVSSEDEAPTIAPDEAHARLIASVANLGDLLSLRSVVCYIHPAGDVGVRSRLHAVAPTGLVILRQDGL
jgi:hypothetical protein